MQKKENMSFYTTQMSISTSGIRYFQLSGHLINITYYKSWFMVVYTIMHWIMQPDLCVCVCVF